jgi:hypothetical protein
MPANPIAVPSGYATAFAVGFADAVSGNLSLVDSERPLPVITVAPGAASTLAGTATSSQIVGPFVPATGRPVYLTLSGSWQGTVSLERSINGGTTRYPVTLAGQTWGRFTGNVCEPVWEEQSDKASLFLNVVLTSGTLSYSLTQ